MKRNTYLWRGDLSPLGCEAAPYCIPVCLRSPVVCIGAASQPSGSKLPRHTKSEANPRDCVEDHGKLSGVQT